MTYDYLTELSLFDEEKVKLSNLGASTPAALLSMIRAAPEAFKSFLGNQRTRQLEDALDALISADERTTISGATASLPPLGAIIDRKAPSLKSPRYDIAERDLLFHELQRLRRQSNHSEETRRRIIKLEHSLNALLEGR